MQCNSLIVGFLFDTPPCSQVTCPEMRASEWQFLCAVHDQPKSCCAIDYCCHTLDWAANVVTNPKIFPSRFMVLNDGHDKNAAFKNLVNVFRRLHRIFAHAWFQHRGVFWNVEAQTGLYIFFKRVCDLHELLPAENYKLPPEAEGLEPTAEKEEGQPKITAIAKAPARENGGASHDEDDRNSLHARRTNTTRHHSRPSTGISVTTVIEEREDEHAADINEKLKGMHISAPEASEEESEVEVPVMVEGEVLDEKDRQPAEDQEKPSLEGPTAVVQDAAPEKPDSAPESSPSAQPEVSAGQEEQTDPNDPKVEAACPPSTEDEKSDDTKPTETADATTDGTTETPAAESGSDSNDTVKDDTEKDRQQPAGEES
jgi:hypothetical protein